MLDPIVTQRSAAAGGQMAPPKRMLL